MKCVFALSMAFQMHELNHKQPGAKHKQNPNIASKYILCYEPIVFCSISSQIESYGIAHHRQAAKHCTAHFLKRLCVYDSTLFNAFSLRNMLPV